MPHTRSAAKNLRKAEKRRLRNRATIKAIKTHVKRFTEAVKTSVEAGQKEYNLASKKLGEGEES